MSEPGAQSQPTTGQRVARGTLFALSARVVQTLFQLSTNIFLARLLSPGDYGLVAEVTAITGLVIIFQDFGLTTAGLQADEITAEESSLLFLLSTGTGALLSLVMIAAGPLLASFYHQPRLHDVAIALSPTFLIAGLSSQFSVQSLRALRFRQSASADFGGTIASTITSLVLAVAGAGYWSLVVGLLTGQATRLLVLVRVAHWVPGRPAPLRQAKPFAGVGVQLTFVQALNYFSQTLDVLLIGRYRGPRQAAYYNRAYYLMLFPLQQVNGPLQDVTLPVLSSLRRDQARYNRFVRTAVLIISYILIPGYALLGATATPIISMLYGSQWTGAERLLTILALAGAARAFSNLISWLSTSLGTVPRQVSFTLLSQPIVLASLWVGIKLGGTVGVTLAYSITAVLFVPTGIYWVSRGTFIKASQMLRWALFPSLLAIGVFLAAREIVDLSEGLPSLARFSLGLLAWPAVLGLAISVSGRARSDLRILWNLRLQLKGSQEVPPNEHDAVIVDWDHSGDWIA